MIKSNRHYSLLEKASRKAQTGSINIFSLKFSANLSYINLKLIQTVF